jgi:hypothetical protein
MTWKVATPSAQTGGTVLLTGGQPKQTVAQLQIQSDSGEAIPATFYLGSDPTAVRQNIGQSGPLPGLQNGETLQWILEWGYGGAAFSDQIEANSGQYTRVGDWFRLTALIVPVPGSAVTPADAIKVRGMLVPATAAQYRTDTVVGLVQSASPPTGSLANILQILPPVNAGPLGVNPVTLLRLWGYNGGSTGDYIQLFDFVTQPGSGATQIKYVAGFVAKQGTFSFDNSPEGIPFSNSAWIAISTTPDSFTPDAGADFSINWEILPVPTF